ncbi:MAG: type IV pilin protein [bacterium]
MNDRGFTLIELMVVVVIIGILAAVAIPNYAAMQMRARESATKENMHTLQVTLEDFNVRADGIYPGNLETTISTVNPNIQGPDGNVRIAEFMEPPYGISSLLPDNVRNSFSISNDALQNKRCEMGDIAGIIGYEASNTTGDDPISGNPWTEAGDGPAMLYRITGTGRKGPLPLVLTSAGVH